MTPEEKSVQLLSELVTAVQNLFILQALQAGITAESVRALAGVDKRRITRISRVRKKDSKT
jgi:hypothetical protein